MAGTSGSAGSRPGRGGWLVAGLGCGLPLLAVLIGIAGLVTHFVIKTPNSPYQVAFSESGDACGSIDLNEESDEEDEELILDEETGEVLYCTLLPPVVGEGRAHARGVFDAEEVARVTGLSQSLAAEGGLSEADRRDVEDLVAEIGRENGHEKTSSTTLEDLTWRVGLYSLIGGLAVPFCVGLWAHFMESGSGPPGRAG
ncbi:hypothetical protein [Streptomyces marincola]|uniref:Uncharacterized protein n=1 Tax=Streptomyces marincola TaxID=2878388 RepID=A0A1W7D4P0_9ACTN|nr:hypothetical protein [Streptomyces marincola]ARQ71530.1 hypothetical protein CAG99_24300 [Streptomyces marincola]